MGGEQPDSYALAPFYKSAMAVVYVFDLTSLDSLTALTGWHHRVNEHCDSTKVVSTLLGTKRDLKYLREVDQERVKEQKEALNAQHYAEVSALEERGGVEEAMVELISSVSQELVFGYRRPIRLHKEPSVHSSCI